MKIKSLTLLIASTFALAACGGGGGGSATPQITDPELKNDPEAMAVIEKAGGAENPTVQAINNAKDPKEVVKQIADNAVAKLNESIAASTPEAAKVDLGDTTKVRLSVGNVNVSAATTSETATSSDLKAVPTENKAELVKAIADLGPQYQVDDRVVRLDGETGQAVERAYRIYNQKYSTVTAYMGQNAFAANGQKMGGNMGEVFKFDQDNGLVGNSDGTLAAIKAKTAPVTYTGKAFDAAGSNGTLNYTINFGSATVTGAGKIEGLSVGAVALEQAALKDANITGKATGGYTGTYNLNVYGPNAEEVAGTIKNEAGTKSFAGFGGTAVAK